MGARNWAVNVGPVFNRSRLDGRRWLDGGIYWALHLFQLLGGGSAPELTPRPVGNRSHVHRPAVDLAASILTD